MSIVSITKALENKLQTISTSFQTARDGITFNPTEGVPFQTATIISDPPLNPTLGDNYYRETGTLRVRLFYPDRQGKGAILQRAELVRDTFHRGLSLTQDGIVTIVERTPSISSVQTVGDRLVLVIDISYFASVFRP